MLIIHSNEFHITFFYYIHTHSLFFPHSFLPDNIILFIPQEGLVSSFTSYVQMILCVYINLGVKNELTHDICLSKSHLFHLI